MAGRHRRRRRFGRLRETPPERIAEVAESLEIDAQLARETGQTLPSVAHRALAVARSASGRPPEHAQRGFLAPRRRAQLARLFLVQDLRDGAPVLLGEALEGGATLFLLRSFSCDVGFDRPEGERSVAAREPLQGKLSHHPLDPLDSLDHGAIEPTPKGRKPQHELASSSPAAELARSSAVGAHGVRPGRLGGVVPCAHETHKSCA